MISYWLKLKEPTLKVSVMIWSLDTTSNVSEIFFITYFYVTADLFMFSTCVIPEKARLSFTVTPMDGHKKHIHGHTGKHHSSLWA